MIFELAPNLFVGNYNGCQVHNKKYATIHLDNCCGNAKNDERNLYFDIRDLDESAGEMLEIAHKIIPFVDKYRSQGVLIHCTAGVSRSPTLIYLYLFLKEEYKSRNDFEANLKQRGYSWFPNPGFQALMRELEFPITTETFKFLHE